MTAVHTVLSKILLLLLFGKKRGIGLALALSLPLLLTACAGLLPDSTPAPTSEGQSLPVEAPTLEPSATPAPATSVPTEVPRDYRIYQHVSGVFGLTIPIDWEALDASTDQRLLVRYIPPVGYGSRVTVDVTNEGPLPPYEVQALAESYVHLNYTGSDKGYTEIDRSELPDGRLQFVFLYDDGRGASGRETLYIRQAGPYFGALRVFLSEKDTFYLSEALDTMTASFAVDPLAVWGTAVAAINPAELLVVNSLLWRDKDSGTHFTGEVYNASPASISEISVRVAFCTEAGIVQNEITRAPALRVIQSGRSSPFAFTVENLPEEITVCAQQVSAKPAPPMPTYTTALSIDPSARLNSAREVELSGTLTNPGLSPVTNVDAILVVYNADGQVIGQQTISFGPDVTLAPGESHSFNYAFPALGGEGDRFVVLAQGEVVVTYNPSLAP
jgi:hypothetical protein